MNLHTPRIATVLALLLSLLLGCMGAADSPAASEWSRGIRCPAEWVASARGGCGPAVVLCAPDGGAAPGACAAVDLSRSHPVGDGGESFRLGPDGDIAGGWRWPGEPGGPPSPTWTPDAGAGAPAAEWHPDAGIPTCPAGWARTADGLCDPALRACPTGAESLPGGQCTRTAEADCPTEPYADPGPEATGAPVAYVSADAPASCAGRGSRACPWRTIGEALASNAAWLLVGDGTYRERMEITDGRHVVGRCAARVTIEGADPERTVYVHGAGASLDLQGVTVTGVGIGINVEDGANVRARNLRVSRAVRNGVRVRGPSSFDGSDIVVADTRPLNGEYGNGANVDAGGRLRLARAAVLRNASLGAGAFGGELTVQDSVVSSTVVAPRVGFATGIFANGDGRVIMERTLIADNANEGVHASGIGGAPIVALTDVVVRGTRGVARRGAPEAAVWMQLGATLNAERLLVDGNLGHGVYVEQAMDGSGMPGPISHATIRDSVIRGPRTSPSGSQQVGLFAQQGSDVHASGLRVLDATRAGVIATGAGTTLTLADTVVSSTREDDGPSETSLGCGMRVEQGARVTGVRVEFADNARLGVLVDAPLGGSDRTEPDLVLEDSAVRGNRHNRTLNNGGGVLVQLGASALLRRVRVSRNEARGVTVAGATLTLLDAVLEESLPEPQTLSTGRVVEQAQNLVAQGGAAVHVTSLRSLGGRGATGALATGAGSTLTVSDSLFDGPDREDSLFEQGCLVAEIAGQVVAERVVLRRCLGIAAYAQTGGASLRLTDAVVQDTRSLSTPDTLPLGRALSALDTASLSLTRVLVEGSPELGALVAGEGTSFAMSSVVIRNIRALPNTFSGHGVFAQAGASVVGDRVLITDCAAGVVSTTGATVALADAFVTDVRAPSREGLGDGFVVTNGGALTLDRVIVHRAFNTGVTVFAVPSRASLHDVVIDDVRANPASQRGARVGRGLQVLNGGAVDIARLAVAGASGVGVMTALLPGVQASGMNRLSVDDLFVRGIHQRADDAEPAGQTYGYGLSVGRGTSMTITRGAIDDGLWGFAVTGGSLALHHVAVTRQSQGVGLSSTSRANTDLLTDDVFARDNLLNTISYDQHGSELALDESSVSCSNISTCMQNTMTRPSQVGDAIPTAAPDTRSTQIR